MKRHRVNGQSTAMLWASWIAATAFGWAIGWAVGSGLAGEAFGGPVSAGIGGTLAGLAQGMLLALAGYWWGRWWALVSSAPVLTAVGAGVAFTIASGGRLYVGLVGIPAIVIMTVAGQWWVLRKRVRLDRAGRWVIGVLAGFIAGGAAVSLLRFGARIPIGASGDAILGGIGGAVLGGTMAAVNGAVLMWLLGRSVIGWTGGFAVEDNDQVRTIRPTGSPQGFFGPDLGEVEPGTVDCNDFEPADAEPFFWTVEDGNLQVH